MSFVTMHLCDKMQWFALHFDKWNLCMVTIARISAFIRGLLTSCACQTIVLCLCTLFLMCRCSSNWLHPAFHLHAYGLMSGSGRSQVCFMQVAKLKQENHAIQAFQVCPQKAALDVTASFSFRSSFLALSLSLSFPFPCPFLALSLNLMYAWR